MTNRIVTIDDWKQERIALLQLEKELTQARDRLSAKRRELPWVQIEKNYLFESTTGTQSLDDLFGPKSQLVIYHFMYGPDWEEGCKSCSFWADNFDTIIAHLAQRDVSFRVVSRAPIDVLGRFKRRMGWSFEWVSSINSDFNYDFHVSFNPEQDSKEYNYQPTETKAEELPGVSVFYKDGNNIVYHTYSTYSRGLDMLNGAYHYLDLVPKGRDEDDLPNTMAWLKLKDQY